VEFGLKRLCQPPGGETPRRVEERMQKELRSAYGPGGAGLNWRGRYSLGLVSLFRVRGSSA